MKSFFKALALALVLLIGITAPGFAGDTIKLGSGGVISGDLAPYGISAVRGVEIAIEDINAKGGILGKQIELLVGDDVCKPEVSVNMATKLVSDGAQMIVGHVCSGATIAANKIYKDAGLIVVSPASTNDDLTLKGEHPNFFRTISYDGAQAALMTSYVKNDLKVKTVALIHDKGDYGKGQMELARKLFEKLGGVEVVLFEGVTTLTFFYPCIPLCFMLRRTSVEQKHTHMCIISCHMLYIVITIFTYVAVRTCRSTVILMSHLLIPITSIKLDHINLTMKRVVPELIFSMVYTHVTYTTCIWFSCF
jgi:hypothetical protein